MAKDILGTFDGADVEGIVALIDKLEKSQFDYLKLEDGGFSVTIGKNGAGDSAEGLTPLSQQNTIAVGTGAILAQEQALPQGTAAPEIPAQREQVAEAEGILVIKAPSQCRFYAQPEPGAPPYVAVGAKVMAGDTIGLMEIMKTFSAISSAVGGEVVAIHVINEEYLEPGQPIVSIKVAK